MAFNFSQTKKEFLSAIVFAFLSFSLFSADAKFSGAVTGEMGMPFPYALGSGDFSTAIVRFDGNLYLYATDSLTFYASGSALLDAMAYQKDSYDLAGKDGMFGLSLNEAWVDYSTDYWAVRIGRQINAWGTADGIAVTDILCPKNYTSIDSMLSTDSRLGIDAARVSAKFDKFAFDFYWIPFVRTIALPTSASHPLTKDFANDNDLALRLAKSRKVDISAENFEYALKASAYWKYADVSLYAFYGWDRFPSEFNLYTKEDGKAVYFEGIHKRILMFGADAFSVQRHNRAIHSHRRNSQRGRHTIRSKQQNDFSFGRGLDAWRLDFVGAILWRHSFWRNGKNHKGQIHSLGDVGGFKNIFWRHAFAFIGGASSAWSVEQRLHVFGRVQRHGLFYSILKIHIPALRSRSAS